MNPPVFIIGLHEEGRLAPVTLEMMAVAHQLGEPKGAPPNLLIGAGFPETEARRLAAETGVDITLIHPPETIAGPDWNELLFKQTLPSPIWEPAPGWVCLPHTSAGLDAAPALAVDLQAACITGVEKILPSPNGPRFVRSICNDKLKAVVAADRLPVVITVAPGAFSPSAPAPSPTRPGRVRMVTAAAPPPAYRFLGFQQAHADNAALNQAEVIVAAGNGFKRREDLALVHNLAKFFPKSAVAGSRPVCDKRWLSLNQQVGVTGATVQPKLYIACGISGASQHIAGMKDAKWVVAINTDPHAAIFHVADIAVIDDALAFIPAVIQQLSS